FAHDLWRQAGEHFTAVDDRRGTAHRRRLFAEEQLFARPLFQVRTFVVVQDHLFFGIGRGAVGVAAALFFRQVTVAAVQGRFDDFSEALEFLRRAQRETTEQDAAVTTQCGMQ